MTKTNNHKRTVGKGAEYYEYLKSDDWKATRARYLRSGLPNHCYICHGSWQSSFVFHHRTYRSLGNENLKDIVPVCRSCHDSIHEYQRSSGERVHTATKIVRQAETKLRKKENKLIRRQEKKVFDQSPEQVELRRRQSVKQLARNVVRKAQSERDKLRNRGIA